MEDWTRECLKKEGGSRAQQRAMSHPCGRAHPSGIPALVFAATFLIGSTLLFPVVPGPAARAEAQPLAAEPGGWSSPEAELPVRGARIWFPNGPEPAFRRGEPVPVHFEVDREAYIAVAQLDTAGQLHLHFPSGPRDPQWIRGGQEHLLLLTGGRPWIVADGPGMGHFFILASDRPLDWSRLGYTRGRGWDLSGAMAPSYSDPNDAMDDLVWAVLPHWQEADFSLDLASYRVVR